MLVFIIATGKMVRVVKKIPYVYIDVQADVIYHRAEFDIVDDNL